MAVSPDVFEILTFKAKNVLFYQLSVVCMLDTLLGEPNPLEFRDKTYCTKTRGMGLPCGANFIILTSTVFD